MLSSIETVCKILHTPSNTHQNKHNMSIAELNLNQ